MKIPLFGVCQFKVYVQFMNTKTWTLLLMGQRNALAPCILLGGSKNMHIKPFGELPFSFVALVGGQKQIELQFKNKVCPCVQSYNFA